MTLPWKTAAFFLLTGLLVHCATTPLPEGELFHPVTEDGYPLSLEHFPANPGATARKYPIILCHGFMASRNYFKMNGSRSLAMELQARGYDVWLLDLRGRPDAGSPSVFFGDYTYNYNMDDYIRQDMDTAISFVLARTGKDGVNWVGHSMGGMIAYARIGSYGETRIKNLITLGSPFLFTTPTRNLNTWNSLGICNSILPVLPMGSLARLERHSCISLSPDKYLMDMFWYPDNLPEGMLDTMKEHVANNIAPGVIEQFAGAVEKGDVRSIDGEINYTRNLGNIKIPVLLVGGRRDHLGSPYMLREIYERLGSQDRTLFIASRANGQQEDYGHTDLFVGIHAFEDILPVVLEWLDERN
ncbi:MAG: alpha/beta fold hydrolase [Leptospiraceae bacterium]|nr:alpha/beta fold hydrolase [Leptospiraceae bacterium]